MIKYKVLHNYVQDIYKVNPLLHGIKNDWSVPLLEEAILKSPKATYKILETYKLKISAVNYKVLVDEVRWNF